MARTFLAVDVGGTKCELALFDVEAGGYLPLDRNRYPSGDYQRLEDIVAHYIQYTGTKPEFACLGVAGVVREGVAAITNLPWVIDAQEVARRFGMSGVSLINDLTAVCASLPLLQQEDLVELQQGEEEAGQPIGVIAPGTGLGEGLLLQSPSMFFPQGSEGGHADFAPVTDEQLELLRWMRTRRVPVSYETLIAGPGIGRLYSFYVQQLGCDESEDIHKQLRGATDKAPVIFAGALRPDPCPLCLRVVELFLAILGSEAGNLALKLYARGGLYIGGGIVPRLAGKVSFTPFLQAFCDKGKMHELMTTIPVRLITRKDAALIGAAHYGRRTLGG